MHDHDHQPRSDLVAHAREKNERNCDRVMQSVLVELQLGLALDDHHFEKREEMDPQLNHEVNFYVRAIVCRPVRVILVDLVTGTATAHHRREPVLIPEDQVGKESDQSIENSVVR